MLTGADSASVPSLPTSRKSEPGRSMAFGGGGKAALDVERAMMSARAGATSLSIRADPGEPMYGRGKRKACVAVLCKKAYSCAGFASSNRSAASAKRYAPASEGEPASGGSENGCALPAG